MEYSPKNPFRRTRLEVFPKNRPCTGDGQSVFALQQHDSGMLRLGCQRHAHGAARFGRGAGAAAAHRGMRPTHGKRRPCRAVTSVAARERGQESLCATLLWWVNPRHPARQRRRPVGCRPDVRGAAKNVLNRCVNVWVSAV